MRYMNIIYVCLCFLATSAAAQTTQTQWVFECRLNNGANHVGVHIYGNEITYHYANADGLIELNINDTVANVDLTLALWDDPNFTEHVTFHNGETSYQVFGEAGRNRPLGDKSILGGGAVDGGVLISSPDGTRTEILCDPNTIEPKIALHRFARLASLKDPNFDLYTQCLASDIIAGACADYALQYCNADTQTAGKGTLCLQDDFTRREAQLSDTYIAAFAATNERGEDTVALERSQEIWRTSREAYCVVAAWTVYDPFDGDKGWLLCLSDYAVKRVMFLEAHINGLQFDG